MAYLSLETVIYFLQSEKHKCFMKISVVFCLWFFCILQPELTRLYHKLNLVNSRSNSQNEAIRYPHLLFSLVYSHLNFRGWGRGGEGVMVGVGYPPRSLHQNSLLPNLLISSCSLSKNLLMAGYSDKPITAHVSTANYYSS